MKKTAPLKSNNEFLRVFRKGRFYAGKHIVLYVLKNNLNVNRLGITASKKFGKSVKRNRIRRLIKENYRCFEDFIAQGNDIVFVAKKQEVMPGYHDIKKEMKFLLKKFELMVEQE